jgi:uncharacterized protein (DUF608 family)
MALRTTKLNNMIFFALVLSASLFLNIWLLGRNSHLREELNYYEKAYNKLKENAESLLSRVPILSQRINALRNNILNRSKKKSF